MGQPARSSEFSADARADLIGAARRAGGYLWLEQQLFELLGGWVPLVPEPATKRLVAKWCHHHAWHAELWEQRLPELEEYPADALTVAPSEATAALVDRLTQLDDQVTTPERLVGVVRVLLPRLVAAYSDDAEATCELVDGPTARVLELCLADVTDDVREGERLLESLLSEAGSADLITARQVEFEALFATSG